MIFTGQVIDGKVVFDGGSLLPEGTHVKIEPISKPDRIAPKAESKSLLEKLKNVVGQADGLPEDAATNVDHYLYGPPKQ